MVDDGDGKHHTQHDGYAPTLLTPPTGVPIVAAELAASLRALAFGTGSRSMATRQREATKQIEVQSWHLRQLVAR